MDREQVRRWEAQCIQEQPPACTTGCPLHVDARQLVERVSRGDFKAGLAVLASAVPLPLILAHICDHPCQMQCRRSDAGDAIEINALERACAEFGGAIPPMRVPNPKNRKVLIVGGELSGVSAALLLAQKGYEVNLLDSGPALLSNLRALGERRLPEQVIAADLDALSVLGVSVRCNAALPFSAGSAEPESLLSGYDAVFFEARMWPHSDPSDSLTLATLHTGIFAGNASQKQSPILAVYEGSVAAISVDRFLQGASLEAGRNNQGAYTSRLYVNTKGLAASTAIRAQDASYSKEEAQQEALRCIPCQCLECVKVCQYLEDYGSYPKRYVRQIYNNECIVMGVRNGNRMVNACSLCGLCTAVCPEDFSMADVCLDARQTMVRKGKMPPSAHDFALRDMAFSQSDAFTLTRHQPGFQSSQTAFLPGCQLSASSPDHVVACYEHLRTTLPGGVGLILQCCGAPARWAGDEEKFQEALRALDAAWSSLGQPRLITACSSCFKTLKEHLPHIPVEPLWPHLDPALLTNAPPEPASRTLAIHDPCSTRGVPQVEDSARTLLTKLGINIVELNEPGLTTCCGYGGLTLFVNPALADKTVTRRAKQSDADYVTYCAMCRDRFAHQGKRGLHILDLVFADGRSDPAARPDPGFSKRQDNRAHLKARLLREVWSEERSTVEPSLKLQISEDVRQLLEKRMILIEDVRRTIEYAENTGDKLEDPTTLRSLASFRSACVTHWVEYSRQQNEFVVHDAYFHRMEVR
jgi:glutamate synthase (NADPH/NADH) small chain